MEPVSPLSDMDFTGNGRADKGYCSCGGDTVPWEDTLPLEEEEEIEKLETQLLGGATELYGETQLLDDPECAAAGRNRGGDDNLFRTQPMEGLEENEVVGDDDEGSERTLLLCDEDELSDDAATPCGVGGADGGEKVEDGSKLGTRTLPPIPRSGHMRRSFTEVRAAALRASGLAAACSTTPEKVAGVQIPSFCNDIRTGVSDLDLEIGNSDNCMQNGHKEKDKNKGGNLTARKLTFEDAISGEDKSIGKKMDNGNSDTLYPLFCNDTVAGLSYVDSQEPGVQSQADALDAIEKFLSINDVGFSQEQSPGKPCRMKTPPVSGAKGAHCLAKMGANSRPVEKAGVFEWVDTLEDEGGGEFFSKKKYFFFGNSTHVKGSHNKSLKSSHYGSRIGRVSFEKTRKHEGTCPGTDLKTMNLTSSEPKLKQHSGELWASQEKTDMILHTEITGQSCEDPTMLHSQREVGRGEENIYDIGPDTQMAAEAMESLVCRTFPDHEPQDSHPDTGNVVKGTSMRTTGKNASSRCISIKKRGTSVCAVGGSIRRSKRIKDLLAGANLHSSSAKESFNSSKLKRDLRQIARIDIEDSRSEKLLCTLNSTEHKVLERNPSHSFRTEKVHGKAGRSSTSVKVSGTEKQVCDTDNVEIHDALKQVDTVSQEVDGCSSLFMSNDKTPFSKELMQRENDLNVTPVAHRTRKSKVYALRKLGTVSLCEETVKDLMEAKIIPAKRKQESIFADAPEQLSHQGKGSNQVEAHDKSNLAKFVLQKVAKLPDEQCRIDALLGDNSACKKRRTRKSKFGNIHQSADSNSPSLLRHVCPDAIGPCCIQEDNSTVDENANVNLTRVKNKKVDSAFLPSETYVVQAGVKGGLVASGVRTRSFAKSHPHILEGGSSLGIKGDVSTGADLSDINNFETNKNEKVHQDVEPTDSISVAYIREKHDMSSLSDVQDSQENVRIKGTPNERVQPHGSLSVTPQKVNISPVCTSVDPLKAPQSKGLSKSSVARELIRLECTEATFLGSKDLRRRRDIMSIRVCLSHHLDDDIIKHQKKILARLGVPIVSRVLDATHFIADKFVRTRNMLEAMAIGRPVVTHLWLESCGQASCFIDEKNYILRDARKEKEIGFSMPASLAHSRQRPLLQGKRVFITTNVKPDRMLVADLVSAAHGQPMERLGRSATKDDKLPDDLLVISCEEDFAICIPLLEKGAEVFSSELLLNGIVIQKLEYERHRLFLEHVKRTRSTIWLRNEHGSKFFPITKCT